MTGGGGGARARQRGVGIIESLLAIPVLLFVGLGAVQLALLYHAKHALNHALIEAARAGSVAHASAAARREGLARGLVPWLYGASDVGEHAANLVRSLGHVAQAEALGWIRFEQQSPTDASFADWSEPARDPHGDPIDGVREIPNDGLVHRAMRTRPASGVAGERDGEPIGAASGQTLADANLLRLRLDYGVPLSVPVAGRLLAWTLRTWEGCAWPSGRPWGLLRLDAPATSNAPRLWACAMLGIGDVAPGSRPRWPVSVSATVRMQSPARRPGDDAAGAGARP